MSDDEDDTPQHLSTEVVEAADVLISPTSDAKLEQKVNEAVKQILIFDPRLENAEIETIDALRDWARIEAMFSQAYQLMITNKGDSSTERMVRAMIVQKTALRDEIWGPVKDKKARDLEMDNINKKILVDTGTITPQADLDD